jgi:hypothetical protein
MFTKNIKVTAFSVLILGASFFAVALILGASIAKAAGSVSEDVSTPVIENSYALCHDGLDNDNNGTTDMGDRNCAGFATAPETIPDTTNVVVENSYALCHDGLDNDNNGTTDMGDRNCAGFATAPETIPDTINVVVENSYALCHDGLDNDNNGTTDMGDRNCNSFAQEPVATTTPPVVPATPAPSTTSFSSGGSGGSYYGFPTILGTTTGSVLGASVDTDKEAVCGQMFKTYMKKSNKNNNKAEVKKLQKFLNEQIGTKLPITGKFGSQTERAVNVFQTKYLSTVLAPWVEAGLMKKPVATGYFYKTTQYAANKIICSSEIRAFPILK